MRRLLHGLLLPALLVLAQQGALLHALGHVTAQVPAHRGDQPAAPDEDCGLCRAFAQVDFMAAPSPAPMPLLAHLSYPEADAVVAPWDVVAPSTPRNRGPPVRD